MNSVNLDKYSDPFFLGETKEELRRRTDAPEIEQRTTI